MSLQWQTIDVPLAHGLNQRGDARAGNPPALDICTDAQFDEFGGVQTRLPFVAMQNGIWDDGTIGTLADTRKIVECNGELLCFTKEALYSWDATRERWLRKGTHLAVNVEEVARFITNAEQITCDRAELGGLVVYAWAEVVASGGSIVHIAGIDKETGATIMPVHTYSGSRPRVIALNTQILLFFVAANDSLQALSIDPADPQPFPPVVVVAAGQAQGEYDICRHPTLDQAYAVAHAFSVSHFYRASIVTAALVVTGANRRPCDGPVTCAVSPDETKLHVARYFANSAVPTDPGTIYGDVLDPTTLAEATANLVIASISEGPVQQITIAFKPTAVSGQYRAAVLWSHKEAVNPLNAADPTGVYWAIWDTANTIILAAQLFVRGVGLASGAFVHEDILYVNLTFAGEQPEANIGGIHAQLQNTYFLYRILDLALPSIAYEGTAFLVAKSVYQQGGGYSSARGHLPGVASTGVNTYSWCGTERRRIPLDGGHTYADRGPRDVTYTFDSDLARRCVRVGASLVIACGEGLLQYDGASITECGFHVMPYYFAAQEQNSGPTDPLEAGDYAYKITYRSDNARGERDRSTTATSILVPVLITGSRVWVQVIATLHVTHKTSVAVEVWRSTKNPPPTDAPFYLTTNSDPADDNTQNGFLLNDPSVAAITSYFDGLSDAQLTVKETSPENEGVLEGIMPPPASIVVADDTRVFVAGISNDPNRVWYSKLITPDEAPGFNEALSFTVPTTGGRITGLAIQAETLVVFAETSVWMVPGDGFDNTGGGANYGPPRCVAADVGAVNHESIAQVAQGILFKARKGWHLVDRSWNASYVGAPVVDFDGETPLAAHVLAAKHQIRILTAERMLVWDYLVNQWGSWSITGGVSGSLFDGVYHYLSSTGPLAEQSDHSTTDYGMDVETAWIKLSNGLQGMARVRRIVLLGEYRNAHALRIRIARDYKATAPEVWDYFDDEYWLATSTVDGEPEQLRIGPSQQQCQAIKIRITVYGDELGAVPSGESVKLTGLTLEVGAKKGTYSMLPVAQKT